jgi:hypothetical protein
LATDAVLIDEGLPMFDWVESALIMSALTALGAASKVGASGLRQPAVPVKLCRMKRELIALILILAIGLQGSLAAFAATSPSMPTECQTTASAHSDASQDSCCPNGQHAKSCCLDLCLFTVGGVVSPIALSWFDQPSEAPATKPAIFSSRGDSPLIRPPIL